MTDLILNKKKFKRGLVLKGIKRKEWTKKYKISYSHVTKILNGKATVTAPFVRGLIETFGEDHGMWLNNK